MKNEKPAHLTNIDTDSENWEAKDDSYWKKVLPDEVYRITRKKGTERPFSGKYHTHKEKGVYKCSNCGQALFSSETKFDSGTGWPSFWKAVEEKAVLLKPDHSIGMKRIEVLCSRCGAHLGHLFEDGPLPTGKRYCINSLSLFQER